MKICKFRSLLLFISLICMFFSSSCAIQDIDDPKDIDYDAYPFANETMLEVLRCFDEEDTEAFKSLFSEELASKSNIDKQIEDAMKYYEGKCVSHGEVHQENGSVAISDGYYTHRRIIIKMNDIITDKDKKYKIVFIIPWSMKIPLRSEYII